MNGRKRTRWRLAIGVLIVFFARGFALAFDYQSTIGSGAIQRLSGPGASTEGSAFIACGEPARKASDRMRAIVSAIDDVSSSHVRVYESVAPLPPHARPGGCIFYNPVYLNLLMRHLLVQDSSMVEPLVYAIMAHEVGHEMHDDFSAARADISTQTKELQADRFAGYTLQHLNIGLDNITPYYSLAGDEFSGTASSHGDSMRGTAALKNGWDLAEWNQPEDSLTLSEGD
jgi:hypothetical protein